MQAAALTRLSPCALGGAFAPPPPQQYGTQSPLIKVPTQAFVGCEGQFSALGTDKLLLIACEGQ